MKEIDSMLLILNAFPTQTVIQDMDALTFDAKN